MHKSIYRAVHEITGASNWIENPQWNPGTPVRRLGCAVIRALPFSVYELEKSVFFKEEPIAVSGESIVMAGSNDTVNKFMFRYPSSMSLENFKDKLTQELAIVRRTLGAIALPTHTEIRQADFFRALAPVDIVTQVQPRLDLLENPMFTLDNHSFITHETYRDIRNLLDAAETMMTENALYPDLEPQSGNLRINRTSGHLTLLDVIPLYANGSRLIGDRPQGLLERTQRQIAAYRNFLRH